MSNWVDVVLLAGLLLVGPDQRSAIGSSGCFAVGLSRSVGLSRCFAVGLNGCFAVGLNGCFSVGTGAGFAIGSRAGIVVAAACGKDERRSGRHGKELVAPSCRVHVCVLLMDTEGEAVGRTRNRLSVKWRAAFDLIRNFGLLPGDRSNADPNSLRYSAVDLL